MRPQPLVLQPVAVPKPWGGHALAEQYGYALTAGTPVGEVWTLSSLASRPTPVTAGPLAGLSLDEARAAMGEPAAASAGPFPVLIKFLEAVGPLSVQVHPSDTQAQAFEGAPGKTECWRILRAGPEAAMYYGLAQGVAMDTLERAIRSGSLDPAAAFARVDPARGQFFPIPPGTLHTAWGGLVWAEVQTAVDLTYRLWDWGRTTPGRALAIDKALAVLRPDAPAVPHRSQIVEEGSGVRRTLHWATRYFVVEELLLEVPWRAAGDPCASYQIVTPLEGDLALTWRGGECAVRAGHTAYVPALEGGVELAPASAGTSTCVMRVYQANPSDVIVPLLSRLGLARDRIDALVLSEPAPRTSSP